MSCSSRTATLASTTVCSYKTITRLVNKHGLSSESFTGITFTSIKPSPCSSTLAASYSSILSIPMLLIRLYYLTGFDYTSRIFTRIYI